MVFFLQLNLTFHADVAKLSQKQLITAVALIWAQKMKEAR